ncbi:MAG: OmpH family outer membrane protein [Desulfobacteraceae bacterium]|nr:OmpH family outer membrane protein [Desulfobacteraceae bacterium]
MMKVFGAILVSMTLAGASASAADVARIGIIDFQKVLRESEAGKSVQREIQKEGQEMEADLQKLAREIEELDKQLSRDSMVMDQDKRRERQQELEDKKRSFQSKRGEYQSRLREMESELVGKLQDEIFSIAEEIGREEGYLLIIERSAAIYYPDSIDITDKVIKKYNDRFEGQSSDQEKGED